MNYKKQLNQNLAEKCIYESEINDLKGIKG